MSGQTYHRNADGSLSKAEPIGWREEHGLFARFILWALRRPHCDARSAQRR